MLPKTDWNVIPLDIGKLTIYGLFMTLVDNMFHAPCLFELRPIPWLVMVILKSRVYCGGLCSIAYSSVLVSLDLSYVLSFQVFLLIMWRIYRRL